MKEPKTYLRTREGLVHLYLPTGNYLYCGDADDGWDADDFGTKLKRGPVTCPRCALAIKHCRGVRIKPAGTEDF